MKRRVPTVDANLRRGSRLSTSGERRMAVRVNACMLIRNQQEEAEAAGGGARATMQSRASKHVYVTPAATATTGCLASHAVAHATAPPPVSAINQR